MKLHEALGVPLAAIDAAMEEVVLTDADLPAASVIRDSVLQLIRSGGKRLRPMLVLIGGRFGGAAETNQGRLMRTAVLLEFLHMASLVHDDVIDQAWTRRGAPALHRKTGVHAAVHIADYMIARALEWSAAGEEDGRDDGAVRILASLAALAAQLCLGEYGQLHNRFNFDASIEDYVLKTRQKTALLMAACLRAGAGAAGADEDTASLLCELGDDFGMAFQIQDDILDFTQTSEALGKPAGSDLRNGNITLPVLYALEDPEAGQAIRSLGTDSPEEAFHAAIERIGRCGAIQRSAALRDQYIVRAEARIERLRHMPAHRDLLVLLSYFSGRS